MSGEGLEVGGWGMLFEGGVGLSSTFVVFGSWVLMIWRSCILCTSLRGLVDITFPQLVSSLDSTWLSWQMQGFCCRREAWANLLSVNEGGQQ